MSTGPATTLRNFITRRIRPEEESEDCGGMQTYRQLFNVSMTSRKQG